MQAETIAAIATPWGRGGIGIIKISGPQARPLAADLFIPGKFVVQSQMANGLKPDIPNCRNIQYGHIVDPLDKNVVDEVMLTVMPGPNTYTREDVVEINAHAGFAVLKQIMKLVLDHGARLAEPGEFTIRAFMNGRIDLIRAEAVIDIINARTLGALKIARRHLIGDMTDEVEALRSKLLDLLTNVEADIEFGADNDAVYLDLNSTRKAMAQVADKIKALLKKYDQLHIVRDGLKLAIVGKPNVGKSSLLNAFINDERALVTAFPGTTRDLIRENLNIAGIPVIITDTAGLHESDDPIEKLGIEKAWQDLALADMALFVVDGSREIDANDIHVFFKIGKKPCVIVQNKSDLSENEAFKIGPDEWSGYERVKVSALKRMGFEELQNVIAKIINQQWNPDRGEEIVPNLRQAENLKKCSNSIRNAIQNLQDEAFLDLCAIDIRDAINELEQMLGIKIGQDVIENIFNRFCVGK